MLRVTRLLIVDDDPLVLTVLPQLAAARLEQVHIDTTDSPYTAFDRIKANVYDAVISDVRMAGMNGFDLVSRIGTIRPGTSIVLMVGARDPAERVLSCDILAYLDKPIDHDRFLRTVSHAIEKSRAQRLIAESAEAFELSLYSHCYGD